MQGKIIELKDYFNMNKNNDMEEDIVISTMKDKIEEMVYEKRVSYIDAMLQFCEDNNIDPSSLPVSQIPKPIYEKIEAEAYHRNLLKDKIDILQGI